MTKSLAVGQSHRSIPVFADINNDGIMDIYYGGVGYTTSEKSWYVPSVVALNQGNNSWSLIDQNFKTSWGYGSKTIDYNQDGLVDILFFTGEEGDVKDTFGLILLKNNGDGTFTNVEDPCLAGLNLKRHIYERETEETMKDDNGNPLLDDEGNEIKVKETVYTHKNNRSVPLQSLTIGDYNKDGYPDILVMGEDTNGNRVMKLLKNNAGTGFETTGFSLSMNNGTVWMADFTGDGWVDILANGWWDGDGRGFCLALFKNNQDGTFTEISDTAFGSCTKYGYEGAGENSIQVLDYDQDGNLDIFLMGSLKSVGTSWSGKYAFYLKNNGEGVFTEATTNIMAISGATERLNFMADFNGDGFVDYVGKGWGANTGGWTWSINSSTSLDQYNHATSISNIYEKEGDMTMGDWNNDGLLDFVVPDWTNSGSQFIFSENAISATVVKPTAPTGVSVSYNKEAKRLNVKWDCADLSTGSKPFYNLYLKSHTTGKTYMLVPANVESGAQSAYAEFSNYVLSKEYTFENVEDGEYTVGVQAVTYSWQASKFATLHFATSLNLNENAESTDLKEIEYLDVNMNRTFKADVWNTFCVPFDMSTEAFTEVRQLTDATVNGDNVTLNFTKASEIKAGVPYIVKVAEAKTSLTVNDVTVKAAEPKAVAISNGGNTITMVGNYAKTTISNGEFFISNNLFYVADQAVTVKGYRAYITMSGDNNVNRMLIDIDGDATAIEEVLAGEDKLVDVYTISGIRVKNGVKAGEALDGLAKGIYIVNGKKVIK